MEKKRVVITGLGTVNPLGLDVQSTWSAVKQGQSGITTMTRIDPEIFPTSVAGEVKGFNPGDYMEGKEARKMDRFTQFAVVAAEMAVKDAGLTITEDNAERIGVWIGSGIGGMETYENQTKLYRERGQRRVSPFFVPMLIPDMASGQVSIKLGAKGINSCSVTACASGANSIGDAFKVIQRGDAEAMITGGAEAPITEMALAGFSAAKAMSTNSDPKTASRPFDKNRDGFVMAEGAGILILESLESAEARGADIYGEIVGYGATGDAYHVTAPAPGGEGGVRAMRIALKDGGLTTKDVDYINAHGTSTEYNDSYETQAVKTVFGQDAHELYMSSTKSMTGHLLGAAGALEAIFSIKAITDQIVPPTMNYETSDPECDLDYVIHGAQEAQVKTVLSNSLGFGGHNVTLAFKAFEK